MSLAWDIRPAMPADLEQVCSLDRDAFARPWPRDAWSAELSRSYAHVDVALMAPGAIVGVACTWTLGEAAELLRIATVPSMRRQGVGSDLLAAALDRARVASCVRLTLEVGATSREALSLYRRAGFEVVGTRRGYYGPPREDALVLAVELGASHTHAAKPVDSGDGVH